MYLVTHVAPHSALRVAWRSPLARASAVSSALMFAGDIIAQALERTTAPAAPAARAQPDQLSEWSLQDNDWARSARFGWFGLTFKGPFFLYAYRFVDAFLDARLGPVTLRTSLIKAMVSNACMDPFYILGFYVYISALEGLSVEHICDKVRSSFLPALTADLSYWFTANVINFRFVPSTSRVYCVGFFGLLWNIYLSYVNARYNSLQESSGH